MPPQSCSSSALELAIDRIAPGFDAPDTFPGGISLSVQSILSFGSETCPAKTLAGLADGWFAASASAPCTALA